MLVIEIGPEFPYKHPKLTLEPNLVHAWIEDGIISSPGLLNVHKFYLDLLLLLIIHRFHFSSQTIQIWAECVKR